MRIVPALRLSLALCLPTNANTNANANRRHARMTPPARPSISDCPRLIAAVLALFLAAMCFQPHAMAATFTVNDAAGLRAALLTAATNGEDDVIVLAAGTYATGGTAFTYVANELKNLTIQGANGTTRSQVALDGGGTSQILSFGCVGSCGAITLQGLTVQNGNNAGGSGGGVSTAFTNLTFSDVTFSGNHSYGSGGAIYANGMVTVSNSIFSNNTATNGGAIFSGGTVSVTNSIFSNNTSGGQGGAIGGINATVTNSVFSNNTADFGGAISQPRTVVNTTFSGNSAVVSGAAIYSLSSAAIINSVFYGHSTPAIYSTSTYNLYNNLIDTSTGIAGNTPIMAGNVAPGATSPFVDAANGNFRLVAGSLAINAGLDPNSTTFANLVGGRVADIRQLLLTDLQGYVRPAPGTAVDIGAYEYGSSSPPVPVCTLTASPPSIPAGGTSTLTASCSPAATSYVWSANTGFDSTVTIGTVSPTVTTTYTVAGINSAGTGSAATVTVTVTDPQPPTVPTGLSATPVSVSQINLAWTASTDNFGVTAYKVYRGGFLIVTLGNVTSYSDTGLAASTTYSYTVQACDAAGNCSVQSTAASATTPPLVATFTVTDAVGLRAALLAAAANGQDDVIVLAAGTYATGGTAFTYVANEFKNLTIQGANGTTREQVILDGGGASRVLDFGCASNCGPITLRGLTVQNGNASNGGGISASQNLELSDVSVSGNHASGSGGAIFGNFMIVNNAIFSRNTAGGDGGAIYGWGRLTNTLFVNNTAGGNGGAIATFFMLLANSTFSGNSASGHGSAIDIYGSPGDPILNLSFYGYASSLLINSVFYGNPAPAVFIETTNSATLYYNLINTSTDVGGAIPQLIGNVAPSTTSPFVDAANNDFRLVTGSLAIDAGLDPDSTTFGHLANSNIITDVRQALLTDLLGNPRPTPGTAVDIGAYEFLPIPVFISQSDCLFNWAERTFPDWFAPAGAISNTLAPYYYRYYPLTNAYLGTSSADNHVYYLGPLSNDSILDVGALASWLSTAGCQ